MIASRNIADWWLAYWISHTHKPYLHFDNNDNHSSVVLFPEAEFPDLQNGSNSTHLTNLTAAGDNLAFYLGIYGGLATANSVSKCMIYNGHLSIKDKLCGPYRTMAI